MLPRHGGVVVTAEVCRYHEERRAQLVERESHLALAVDVEDRVLHCAEPREREGERDRVDPRRELPGDDGALAPRRRLRGCRRRRGPFARVGRRSANVQRRPRGTGDPGRARLAAGGAPRWCVRREWSRAWGVRGWAGGRLAAGSATGLERWLGHGLGRARVRGRPQAPRTDFIAWRARWAARRSPRSCAAGLMADASASMVKPNCSGSLPPGRAPSWMARSMSVTSVACHSWTAAATASWTRPSRLAYSKDDVAMKQPPGKGGLSA